jgi:hypothetical protein
MRIKVLKIFFVFIPVSFFSCAENTNEDVTNSVNRAGSVEASVHINHLDSTNDELVTIHKVWVKQNLFKTVEYHDTIPALGVENKVAENEEGDTKSVSVKKDYEIYITVK